MISKSNSDPNPPCPPHLVSELHSWIENVIVLLLVTKFLRENGSGQGKLTDNVASSNSRQDVAKQGGEVSDNP